MSKKFKTVIFGHEVEHSTEAEFQEKVRNIRLSKVPAYLMPQSEIAKPAVTKALAEEKVELPTEEPVKEVEVEKVSEVQKDEPSTEEVKTTTKTKVEEKLPETKPSKMNKKTYSNKKD